MIKLSKEQCEQIRESVKFHLTVAQATNTSSLLQSNTSQHSNREYRKSRISLDLP